MLKNKELGAHINGDDGMSLGASFLAANYSAGIRTKKLFVQNGPSYDVEVKIRFNNETDYYKQATLFEKNTK